MLESKNVSKMKGCVWIMVWIKKNELVTCYLYLWQELISHGEQYTVSQLWKICIYQM